ncbi:MAG TPA: PepSY-like domain-containing protein [Terriglobales bacterium]|nr:PepSY-like domain-containing protein [Terriglobales bacterium]
MTLRRTLGLLTSSLLPWLGSAAAQEAKIKFKDLPPAVQETAKAQSQGATVRGYSKEIEKGKTEYEVQLLVDGKKRDVSIDPNGKVLETEQEVAFDSVPQKAQDAIKQEAGGAKVEKVEAVKSDQPTVYEALIHQNGKKHEIRVLESGEQAPPED